MAGKKPAGRETRPLRSISGGEGVYFAEFSSIDTKISTPHYERKNMRKFVIFSENVLDILRKPCYIIQARVGNKYARTAMMQEIASKDGNFCGVCPVIGRLNCFESACVYRCAEKDGSASVGHFSWLGVIRTAARTKQFDRTQTPRKLST